MKNRVLAMMLSLTMGISLLAGCGSPKASEPAPAQEEAEAGEEEEASEEAKAEPAAASEDYYIEWANQQWGLSAEEIDEIKAMNLSFAIETPTESEFGYGQMAGSGCTAVEYGEFYFYGRGRNCLPASGRGHGGPQV